MTCLNALLVIGKDNTTIRQGSQKKGPSFCFHISHNLSVGSTESFCNIVAYSSYGICGLPGMFILENDNCTIITIVLYRIG